MYATMYIHLRILIINTIIIVNEFMDKLGKDERTVLLKFPNLFEVIQDINMYLTKLYIVCYM